jgi:GxxExxY protein
VHSILGPGLLESAYRLCLAHELTQRGVQVQAEIPVPIVYDGLVIDVGYRIDLLVE